MAEPTAPACPTCLGSRLDPNDPGDYDHAVHMIDPGSIGPCPTCNGSGLRDFGHEPMDVEQFGNGRLHARFVACARCYPNSVSWPCLTAVLLALPTA